MVWISPKRTSKVHYQHQNDRSNQSEHCQSIWKDDKKACKPSPYLDAFMSDKQTEMLQPLHKDVLMGFILYDVKGDGASHPEAFQAQT